jgi:hypothetical protein
MAFFSGIAAILLLVHDIPTAAKYFAWVGCSACLGTHHALIISVSRRDGLHRASHKLCVGERNVS